MKNKYLHLFIICMIAVACNENAQKKEAHGSININTNAIRQMNQLEKMFNNDNWMRIIDNDTSYFNFSRIGNVTKVYRYRMIKGDSVNIKLAEIKISTDTLVWEYDDMTMLYLDTIDDTKAEWKPVESAAKDRSFTFEKKAVSKIAVTAGAEKYSLLKTLPLSSFLIRSHYDFLHGTKYAFSDTLFMPSARNNN